MRQITQPLSHKTKCIKGNNSKLAIEKRTTHIEVLTIFQEKRTEDLARITSKKRKLLRMNRSIPFEGAFGEVKADMSFRHFLCRGKQNVLTESMLLAFAHNVHKLHAGRCGMPLHPLTPVA